MTTRGSEVDVILSRLVADERFAAHFEANRARVLNPMNLEPGTYAALMALDIAAFRTAATELAGVTNGDEPILNPPP